MRLSTLAICFISSALSLSSPAWAGLWPLSAWEAHYKRAGMKSIVFNIQRECQFNHIALETCATLASCVLDKMVDSESRYIELNVFITLIKWANAPTSDVMKPLDDPSRYFVPLRMVMDPSAYAKKFYLRMRTIQQKSDDFDAERNEYVAFNYECGARSAVDIRAFHNPLRQRKRHAS